MDETPQVFSVDSEREYLETVRDLLSKGWNEEALNYVNQLLGYAPNTLGVKATFPSFGAFESAFKTACRKNHVVAAYMALDVTLDKVDNSTSYKMVTGGHHMAEAVLSHHLRPFADSLGVDVSPPKLYKNILDIQRRRAFGEE